jgi:thiamine biosynthesis lipoprotein
LLRTGPASEDRDRGAHLIRRAPRCAVVTRAIACGGLAVALLASTFASAGATPSRLSGRSMGTTWNVTLARTPADRDALQREIEQELQRLTDQMSTWEPASDLSRFNRSANRWQTLPEDLARVLGHALALARDSGGAYDPSVGPLVNLWGFGPDAAPRSRPPPAAAIAAARARIGWQRIEFDAARARARQPGGMFLDVASLGPGYAVDRIAQRLRAAGHDDYLVELGGEMRAGGTRADGEAWRVAVERPDRRIDDAGDFDLVVALREAAIGSSGDYRVGFEYAGRRYSHTIDPRRGEPIRHALAAVSVIAPEAMQADALAAALLVLGPDAGWHYAEHRRIAAVFTLRRGDRIERRMTPGFAAHLVR